MDRGLYAASSGGMVDLRRIQVVGNNLANVNTVGFKAERLTTRQQEFSDTLASKLASSPATARGDIEQVPGAVNVSSYTDFSLGPIKNSDNPLNVALQDPSHFFVVQTPQGEAYTRAGNFTLDSEGTLVTPDGMPVLGEGGPISITGANAKIDGLGNIIINGEGTNRLRTVQFENPEGLRRTEGVRFVAQSGGAPTDVQTQVVPHSVEMPNVSVVEAMVEMISAQRSFEAYTKTIRAIDDLNQKAISSAKTTG